MNNNDIEYYNIFNVIEILGSNPGIFETVYNKIRIRTIRTNDKRTGFFIGRFVIPDPIPKTILSFFINPETKISQLLSHDYRVFKINEMPESKIFMPITNIGYKHTDSLSDIAFIEFKHFCFEHRLDDHIVLHNIWKEEYEAKF